MGDNFAFDVSDDASMDENQNESSAFNVPKEMLMEEREIESVIEKKERLRAMKEGAGAYEKDKKKLYDALGQLLTKSGFYAEYVEKTIVESSVDAETGVYVNDNGFQVSQRQPKLLTGVILRDYQLDGLEWLVKLFKNAMNGILADEMGLGKTAQVIALLAHLMEKRVYGPFLIMAPLSTLSNWMMEFANFAPSLKVIVFHGDKKARATIKNDYRKAKSKPIILTSYNMALMETSFLSKEKWCYVIVDEGHRLKNYNSLLSRQMREYTCENKLLLTGTPLQNNITELWSLLNFLVPETFDHLEHFEGLFNFTDLHDEANQADIIEKERTEQLITKMHSIISPFVLRRMKGDVNLKLPRKKELLVYAPLTDTQAELYKKTIDKTIDEMAKKSDDAIILPYQKRKCVRNIDYSADTSENDFATFDASRDGADKNDLPKTVMVEGMAAELRYTVKMQNVSMIMRRIVNHPYLVEMPTIPGTSWLLVTEDLVKKSGKFLVLDAMLPKLRERGHKILLFSTFVIVLDLLEEYLVMRGYKYERLDGKCDMESRTESIKSFNQDESVFVFLVSTRAGGLGINLTAADTVIIFDSDWNPQVDLQAQDRCHRIGQTKPVVVYRLVAKGTIDEKIVTKASSKRTLEKIVVRKRAGSEPSISLVELKELLRSTDYGVVFHSNQLVYSDQQLELLLDRKDLEDGIDEEGGKRRGSGKRKVVGNEGGVFKKV